MRVLIYEHICGGGMQDHPLPSDLAASGAGMLQSVLSDFTDFGCEVVTTLDHRLNLETYGAQVVRIQDDSAEFVMQREVRNAHATLIMAPETDGVLLQWAKKLQRWDAPTLGSSPSAIQLCSHKHRTTLHLKAIGLPTLKTRYGTADQLLPWMQAEIDSTSQPLILKASDGAGCEQVFVLRTQADINQAATAKLKGDWITQPFIDGPSFSMSFIVTRQSSYPLLIGEQVVTGDKQLHYQGGILPANESGIDMDMKSIRTPATAAVESIPGLHGFVGVDMVVDKATGTPYIVDINPRLTVSYCALRRLSKVNLAAAMLREVVPDQWHAGTVSFDAAGQFKEVVA